MVLRGLLDPALGARAPFLFAFPAVALIGAICGFGPAVLVTAFCAVWLVIPWLPPSLPLADAWLPIAIFVPAAFALAFAGSRLARVRSQTDPGRKADTSGTLHLLQTVGLLAAVLPILLFGAASWHLYDEAQSKGKAAVERVARVAEEHASKVFETNIALINRVLDLLGNDSDDVLLAREKEIHLALQRMADGLPQLQGIFILGENGHMLATDRAYPAPHDIDYKDRELYRHHRDGGTQPFVTEVLTSRATGEPFFDMSLRRSGSDGSFKGAVSTSLRPEYFHEFYSQLAGGGHVAVTLSRADGSVLASWPHPPVAVDSAEPAPAPPDIASRTDDAFTVEQPVGRFPVRVAASLDWSAILAPWYSQISLLAALMFPTAFALVYITYLAHQKTARSLESAARLRDESAHRERVERALRQAQKVEALGRLTGGVAHDFNNLLTIVQNSAYVLRAQKDLRSNPQLAAIERAVNTGTRLTRQLLTFARAQPMHPETIDLQKHLSSILDVIRTAAGGAVQIESSVEPDLSPIFVDPAELELALLNVTLNARDAMPDGGTFRIDVERAAPGEVASLTGSYVVLRCEDTGTGMSADALQHAFEPFFTTKEAGKGTGLGLSQVYGFASTAGGTATVESEGAKGTIVRIYLPAAAASHRPEVPRVDEAAPLAGKLRVLLVDDNSAVALATRDVLSAAGHTVTECAGADSALQELERGGAGFDIVLTDIMMPGTMNGLDLAKHLKQARPDLPVILCSGYSQLSSLAVDHGFVVLTKPVAPDALLRTLSKGTHAA
jgi:signal transduction histidine kinase/membrane protein implicated in regulation of membrane protease activity